MSAGWLALIAVLVVFSFNAARRPPTIEARVTSVCDVSGNKGCVLALRLVNAESLEISNLAASGKRWDAKFVPQETQTLNFAVHPSSGDDAPARLTTGAVQYVRVYPAERECQKKADLLENNADLKINFREVRVGGIALRYDGQSIGYKNVGGVFDGSTVTLSRSFQAMCRGEKG
jgi:hypothetical protein